MKKQLIATFILSAGTLFAVAQQNTGYYFKEFTSGKVMLKNKQFAKGLFNYNCINKEMHFLNGTTDMIVENLADIDTVVVDTHQFIPYEDHFMEVMYGQNSILFIDWKMKPKDMGKKGAMGTTTHGSVQAIDINSRYQRVNGEQDLDPSVYKIETENTYYVFVKKKLKSFKNAKTFLGLYPKEKQQEIRKFMGKQKLEIKDPKNILQILDTFPL